MKPSKIAQRRGEDLATFLDQRRTLTTRSDLERYLELRAVKRYRVQVYVAVVIIALPPGKERVLHDVMLHRPAYTVWFVEPLKWWQRGRQFIDKTMVADQVG